MGASRARNLGIKKSTGEWIQFLDADDYLFPDKIEKQVNLIGKNGDAELVSSQWGTFQNDLESFQLVKNRLFRNLTAKEWILESWNRQAMMQPGAWLVSRNLINRQGLWNDQLSVDDDGEYFTRMIMGTEKILHCKDAKCAWRTGHDGRLSTRRNRSSLLSACRSVLLQRDHVLAQYDDDEIRQAASNRIAWRAYEVALYDYRLGQKLFRQALLICQPQVSVPGGSAYRFVENILGWNKARRMQGMSYQLRDAIWGRRK